MITITGAGDHDRPEWLITMTGIRTLAAVVAYSDAKRPVIPIHSGH
jgi:hypothetical protein